MNYTQAEHNLHLSQLYTGYRTDDQALLKAMDWVNTTIRNFKYRPATYENCRNLREYIREKMLEMYRRPWSNARNELITQCTARIDELDRMLEVIEEAEIRRHLVETIRKVYETEQNQVAL